MAFKVATSKSPRPKPDWFDATTTRQPAWFIFAMASKARGKGRHSSGDFT
jgi:hypothetical protein